MGTEMVRPNGALVARQEFGAQEMMNVTETAGSAVTARETALVQARFIMAMQRTRKLENVRVLLKKACEIWEFADESWYSRPAGNEFNEETGQWEKKYAEGFSIRFAEEAGRVMGNLMSDSQIVVETPDERVVHVWAMDLETNFTRGVSVSIAKVVERKSVKKGQVVVGERENSDGKKVYQVIANPGELLMATNNQVAKAERQCILKMIPAWILRDCKETIQKTLENNIKENPDAAKRKLIDSFAELKILPSDLEMYIGHSLDRLVVKDITELRNAYRSITQGESTWEEWVTAKNPSGSTEAAQELGKLKFERLKKDAESKAPQSTSAETTQGAPGEPAVELADENQQMTLLTLAGDQKIGQSDLKKILAKHGVPGGDLTKIPVTLLRQITEDLSADPAPRKEEAPVATEQSKTTAKPLQFGKRNQ